jgi:iron complex outermembrane recepter protein
MRLRFTRLLVFLLLTLPSFVFAQESAEITGTVLDETGKPLPFANVLLLNQKDSTIVKAGFSGDDGKYLLLPLPKGDFYLKTVFSGYVTRFSEPITLTEGQKLEVAPFQMAEVGTELAGVQIETERPMVTVKPDMLVFNVENTPNAIGENAFNLLRKAPGVMIDNNDNIQLLGKSGLRIYIDGKPSPLDGSDLANFLRSIQSSQIESFEIITNPSSKFDAAGNAGIINIKMKRDKSLGANATVDLGYAIGKYSKYNGSASANYRNKHFSVFGSYSLATGKSWNFMDFSRHQAGITLDPIATVMIEDYDNHNMRAGFDLFASKKSTIGVLASGFISSSLNNNSSISSITPDSVGTVVSILNATNKIDGGNTNLNFNLNYKYDNHEGVTFNADADYALFRINNVSYQPNNYLEPSSGGLQFAQIYSSSAPTDINMGILKVDYERPLLKGVFSTGAKATYVSTDNTYNFYSVENAQEVLDTARSNQFSYTENVNAAYINYQTKIKSFAFQAGLRAEQTNSVGDLTAFVATDNKTVERHYLNLFPSGGLTYDLNKKNTLSLTYSRRIDRPQYQNLNPFEFKLDQLSYMKGNPFLKPQYTNNVELSHTFNYTLNSSISYAYTTDFFTEVIGVSDSVVGASYLTTLNVGSKAVATVSISYPFNITKWWGTYTNLSAYNVRQKGDVGNGTTIDISRSSGSVYHQSNFKLPKDFSIQLSGFYNSPGIWGAYFKTRRFWGMDIGVQKKLLQGRGNVKVSVSDFLYTMQWSGSQLSDQLQMQGRGGWESRQFKVNFSYLFGNKQVKARKRSTGSEDEKERAGGSGDGLGK